MSTIERLKEIDAILRAESWYSEKYHAIPHALVDLGKALPKLLAFVDAWDDCQTVTANQVEKMSILLSARKALDEETK